MGEDNKEENKDEEKKEEGKNDKIKEEEPQEIVLKVDMHCEACARKVARVLKGFEGVEDVATDSKASKVVVRGKMADPIKVYQRLLKKSGRKVELVSPLPKPTPPSPPQEKKKEENKEPKQDKKEEPPAVTTVVLKVRMNCEACAQVLQKRIRKIKGVETVETDVENEKVIVKGILDPTKLVDVCKRARKQASIVMKDEGKKEEEKKKEEKLEEKKKEDENEEGGQEEEHDKKSDIKRSEYFPSMYFTEFEYPQFFSDENPNGCSLM